MALTLFFLLNTSMKTKQTISDKIEKKKDTAVRLSREVCHDTSHVSE